jgi:uncharacterized membrane protein
MVYLVTGEKGIAMTVGALDVVVKLVAFYLHERAWGRIRWGAASSDGRKDP